MFETMATLFAIMGIGWSVYTIVRCVDELWNMAIDWNDRK